MGVNHYGRLRRNAHGIKNKPWKPYDILQSENLDLVMPLIKLRLKELGDVLYTLYFTLIGSETKVF
jgi:hypothetical protein